MAKHKQRRRPEPHMHGDEHFTVDAVPSPAGPTIEIYAKPYHKLMFKASREGLLFWCKRCRQEHPLPWEGYDVWIQAPHVNVRICLAQSDENRIAIMAALTPDAIELIARIKPLITSNIAEEGG